VIARIWSARTTRDRAAEYADYLRQLFKTLHGLDGFERAMLLEREVDGRVEVQVITFWRSLDAIRAFSGPDLEAAVVSTTAAGMLIEYDRRVRHYEIALEDEKHS
jgi:heme-degrading monooxygenase HmoA